MTEPSPEAVAKTLSRNGEKERSWIGPSCPSIRGVSGVKFLMVPVSGAMATQPDVFIWA